MNKNQVYGLLMNLNNVFLDIENKNEYQMSSGKLSEEYFINLLLAFKIHFEQLTKQENDLIEFIGILNKLTFQYLMDNNDGDSNA